MVQFAGYQQEDGTIVGDPAAVGITKVNWTKILMLEGYLSKRQFQFCQELGWKGEGTPFDFLPMLLSGVDGEPRYYQLPDHLCMKVRCDQAR